jgi:hypothetical protein
MITVMEVAESVGTSNPSVGEVNFIFDAICDALRKIGVSMSETLDWGGPKRKMAYSIDDAVDEMLDRYKPDGSAGDAMILREALVNARRQLGILEPRWG